MTNTFYLNQLRKLILKKVGITYIDPSDCRMISNRIYEETRKYVSETTIKRFFGYANSPFNFSGFTLNSLAHYVGYESWKNFCNENTASGSSQETDNWEDLRQKAAITTDVGLRYVRNNSGIPFNMTAKRKFAFIDYQYFLDSKAQISCLIAPAGYGKSIALAQLVTEVLEESTPHNQDILLYLNLHILNNMTALGFNLNAWIRDKLGFGNTTIHLKYFEKHPDARKGKIIIVLDGVDDSVDKRNYAPILLNFLYSLENLPWIKVIMAMRTNTWLSMRQKIISSAFLTSTLYKDNFNDKAFVTNLPVLSEREILHTLGHIDSKHYKVDDIHPGLLEQLKAPFWLQYYYYFRLENKKMQLTDPLLCYELVASYIKQKVFEDIHSTESRLLLQHFSAEMHFEKDNYILKKSQVLGLIKAYPKIYQTLLKKGMLKEERRISNGTPEEVVTMLHDFYPHFLFRHIFDNAGKRINEALLAYICEKYEQDVPLRKKLLNWSVREAVLSNQTKYLVNIITLPFTLEEKNQSFNFACYVINFELFADKSRFNPAEINMALINFMVKGEVLSKAYRDTTRALLEKVEDQHAMLVLQVMYGAICIVELNRKGLKKTCDFLKMHKAKLETLFPINPYELLLFNYKKIINEPVDEKLSDYIITSLEKIENKQRLVTNLSVEEMLSFRIAINTLYITQDYKAANAVMDKILQIYPKIWFRRTSIFAFLSKIFSGEDSIRNNDFKTSSRIFNHLNTLFAEGRHVYYTNFVMIRFLTFKAEYFRMLKDFDQSLGQVENALGIAIKDKLTLVCVSLYFFKIGLLRSIGNEELLEETFLHFSRFLKDNNISIEDFTYLNPEEFGHLPASLVARRRKAS